MLQRTLKECRNTSANEMSKLGRCTSSGSAGAPLSYAQRAPSAAILGYAAAKSAKKAAWLSA